MVAVESSPRLGPPPGVVRVILGSENTASGLRTENARPSITGPGFDSRQLHHSGGPDGFRAFGIPQGTCRRPATLCLMIRTVMTRVRLQHD